MAEDDYAEIDAAARAAGRGVIAAGNFSVLAATLLHAATLAARHVAHWEILDYGSSASPTCPSGTSRELAERLAESTTEPAAHDADLIGPPEARGASSPAPACTRCGCRATRSRPRSCSPRPTSGCSSATRPAAPPTPYIAGTLLAIRRVPEVTGVLRGLDRLLFG